MTHEKAAEIVGSVGSKESYIDWAVSDKQRKAFQIAACVLRSVATASADAEKSYKNYTLTPAHYDEDCNPHHCKQAYLAGHAAATAALAASEAKVRALTEALKNIKDAAEMLWTVLANVSGGDWEKQSSEWQGAAARWRDNYFAALKEAGK